MAGMGLTFFKLFMNARLPEGVINIRIKKQTPADMNIAQGDVWYGNLITE